VIWAVYNGPRVSELKNSVWTELGRASPGRGNWTNDVRNPPTWVNLTLCLILFFCDIHSLCFSPASSSYFPLHLKSMETKTIMEHFKTKNLIFLHLVCLTSLKSNVIFLILFEIFFLTFYVDLGSVTLFFCVCFMIFSSLVTYFRNLNSKGWVCYNFYIYFLSFCLFLTESNRPITQLNRKSGPVKIDLYFMGGLNLIF
jgi:hypothetical protein